MKISCQSCGAKYNIADEKVRGKIVKIACKKCGARIEIDGREPAEQAQDQDETRVFDQAQAPAAGADTWTVSIDDNDQREVTTAQLAELLQQGVVTPETFVWRDGMGDWQAVRDVSALQSVLSGGAAAPSAPAAPAFPSEPPTAAYQAVQHDLPANGSAPLAAAAAGYGSPSIETSQPARLGGSRRGGAVDLFASQTGPAEEEEVATSAPAGGGGMFGAAAAPAAGGKPIGARNENSVLFSLSALTASGPAPGAVTGASDDEKSGLIDIQKLAAAAKPGNGAKDDRAKLDDIMNLGGGGAFGTALGAPILAPPPAAALAESPAAAEEKKGGNKGLIIGMGAVVALLLVAVIVLLVTKKGGDEVATKDKSAEPAKADDKDKDKKPEKKEPAAGGDTAAATSTETAPDPASGGIGKPGTKPAAGGTGTAAAKATAGGSATAAAAGTTAAAPTTTSPGTKCTSLDCMMGGPGKDPPKDPPKPAAGGAEFDKGAAKSSLSAIPYKDCGSGGAGKVTVTFAPSGNVSSAVVTAGEYDGGTKSCIQNRFKGAKVPAFSGDPKPVGWSISL